MAKYFADNGWSDITVAFPINLLEIDLINCLAADINLNLLVDNIEPVLFLETHINHPVNVIVEIDTGYARTGLHWEAIESLLHIVRTIQSSQQLRFMGLLAHAGQSYHECSDDKIRQIHSETMLRLKNLKNLLSQEGCNPCLLSIGDTPSCSITDDFDGIDEIRPGNFVFYDLKQHQIGSCSLDQIAIAIACPVIGKYPQRGEIVIYGGAVHFSKDYLLNQNGEKVFGYMTYLENDHWGAIEESAYISEFSQEHGKLKIKKDLFEKIKFGDILLFLPVHSCLTANLHRNYVTLEGRKISRFNSTF
jgi:D-serine deaminase-like pyridoxal phosphate-dependent protein